MEQLLDHVVVLDQGRVRLDTDVDSARASAFSVAGTTRAVAGFLTGRRTLSTHVIGGLTTATVDGVVDPGVRAEAARAGVELSPVSLQQVVAALGAASDGLAPPSAPVPAAAHDPSGHVDQRGARS